MKSHLSTVRLLLLGGAAQAGILSMAGAVSWQETAVSVKKRPDSDHVEVAFSFENRGPSVARFLEIKPSCDCLSIRLDATEWQPGAAGRMLVTVPTKTREVTKDFTLLVSEDPASRPTELHLRLLVESRNGVDPKQLVWEEGTSNEQFVELQLDPAKQAQLEGVHFNTDSFERVSLDATSRPGRYRVVVRPKEGKAGARAAQGVMRLAVAAEGRREDYLVLLVKK